MVPVIKWVGGKRQLLPTIMKMIPDKFETYYEPFLGGGAVYMALEPKSAVVNDFNPQLTNLYKVIRRNPEGFIASLKELETIFNSLQSDEERKQFYLDSRDRFNSILFENGNTLERASLLVLLNKSGFNGLYRVNSDGLFNVPFGKKTHLNLCDEDNIRDIAKKMHSAKIMTGDFEKACRSAEKGDFVFFDSPYYDTFDTYQAGGFSEADHVRLAKLYESLTDRGVYCMLTNSNTDFIKNLYSDYNVEVVAVKRMVNCDASKRTGEEVIVTNYSNGGAL